MWFSWACAEMRLGLLPDIGSTFLIHPNAHHKFPHDELYRCWPGVDRLLLVKILAKVGI